MSFKHNEQADCFKYRRVCPAPELRVGWTPDGAAAWDARMQAPAGAETVAARLRRGGVPARLADALIAEAGLEAGARMAGLRREHRMALVNALSSYRLHVTGHEVRSHSHLTRICARREVGSVRAQPCALIT